MSKDYIDLPDGGKFYPDDAQKFEDAVKKALVKPMGESSQSEELKKYLP